MFVQVKRNETLEEGNWNNFESTDLFSWIDRTRVKDRSNGLHKLTRKNYIKFQNQSSQKWLEWPIKQKNQTIVSDFGQKIEFFFIFGFWAKMILKIYFWGSFR